MKTALIILTLFIVGCSNDSNNNTNNGQTIVITTDVGTDSKSESDAGEDLQSDASVEDMSSEERCGMNTRYEGVKAILAGGKNNPTGRGEQGAVFDPCNQRVILFGGNDQQPEQCASFGAKNYLGDTWGYSLEFEN